MKIFLMLVFCLPHATTCHVEWSRAIYPTMAECTQVAPSWLAWSHELDKRKATGVLCEIAKRAPASYRVSRTAVPQ